MNPRTWNRNSRSAGLATFGVHPSGCETRPKTLKRAQRARIDWLRFELGAIALLLLVVNWPLLHGVCNSSLIFLPTQMCHGDWWRVLTHPLVHVTWLHLVLDGIA